VTLAVVRSLGDSPRRLRSPQELEDFEQELVDQYALAMSASGVTDGHVDTVREAIQSGQPAREALAALVAFHAVRSGQLASLNLTDVRDGRLHLDGRVIPLAAPVRERLAAWLDERARRWPATVNPHLFINWYTAVRETPVSSPWISHTLDISPQAVREDRILDEALATGGDIRRLCDLFGLTVGGAERYTRPAETGW
jgi:hypothetical protein